MCLLFGGCFFLNFKPLQPLQQWQRLRGTIPPFIPLVWEGILRLAFAMGGGNRCDSRCFVWVEVEMGGDGDGVG